MPQPSNSQFHGLAADVGQREAAPHIHFDTCRTQRCLSYHLPLPCPPPLSPPSHLLQFWNDGSVEALQLGGLPAMQESVTVVGFPQGGDNVCVTKGVVSRLDRQQYSHGRCSLLTLQTDAPINR